MRRLGPGPSSIANGAPILFAATARECLRVAAAIAGVACFTAPTVVGMTALATQREIQEILAGLIARHAGVAVESIEEDTLIWECFPTTRAGEQAVESFVNGVHFGAVGPWARRAWLALGVMLLMNALLLLAYRSSTRRSHWKPGGGH
jgi:hypothetical protein